MVSEYLNLLRLFYEESVSYVIVGGHAAIAHGVMRTTGDIDILVEPTEANAERAVRALVRYGYTAGEFEVADFTMTPNFLSFSHHDVWIDLMTQIAGVSFEQCNTGALITVAEGIPIRYINLGALRQSKAATARPQDLADLASLPPVPPT